jgi:hypothetical protein
MRRAATTGGLALTLMLAAPPSAAADLIRGVGKIITGVLAVPVSVLQGTVHGPPVFGTVAGAINGAIAGVSLVAGGALEVVASGLPLVKAAAPFVLPFLL